MASTTVNFNLKTAGFVNYANQTLTFRLLTAGAEAATGDQSYVTLPGVVTATSAANGDGSVSLFRNGKSGIESVYEVILPNREKAKFIIPSGSATIELATLLVDHVPSGVNVQQSSVYAEAIKRANHTGTQTLSTISDAATVQLKPSEGAFANGDKTKLNGISTSADVTDATTVAGAGALMDSELTSITDVKALNQSVVSGAAPNFATTNMTDASNKRLMTDAQESKLDGIETSADVTDTTNVTAAGALMDSELTSIANVKALNQSLVSGASPVFTTTNITDASNKRFMTDAQETKLDSVETDADETDTANVTAAGALMDSELTDLSGVKGVTISTLQVKPSEGAFVNGDKTKLNGIEAGATTDQTASDIRALVESASDSNVFTNADHTKLNSIATGATGNLTNNEIRNAVEAADNSHTFNDADHTKLNDIEASADVTDTANVTSAGALMDSEVDADIKTLSLPASTTISTFAKTFLDDADAAAVKSTLGITDAAAISNFVPRSITFTNTSTYLSLADTGDHLDVGTGDFSLSFWARLDSSGTEPVLTKLSGTGYRLKFASGSLILTMSDSGGSADLELATGLNDNKWHVYVVSVDRSGNATTYVDNVAQTPLRDVSGTALSLDNGGEFRIGSDGGSNAGDGIALGNYVALHKGSDGALTAAQASQIFFSADAALTLLSPAVAPSLMVDLRKADKTFTDLSTNALAVTTNGTIIFNEGRITSLDGVGDINCSSISADVAATGLNVIFDGTDTGDNKITLTDNLASALDITQSTNSYLKFTTTNSGEKIVFGKDLDISGDHDLIIGTSTGTKIGTATSQKIGFFNATPVVQQNTTGTTTGTSAGSGTALHANATITGGVGSTAYTVGDIVKALKQLGLLAQ